MTLPELLASLGVDIDLAIDDAWPVARYDDRLSCTYMGDVRRSEDAMEYLCSIRAVSDRRRWRVVDAVCCGARTERHDLALEFFRVWAKRVQAGECPDHVELYNELFQPEPVWP